MHISAYRRPLLLALAVYCGLIITYKTLIPADTYPRGDIAWRAPETGADVEGTVTSFPDTRHGIPEIVVKIDRADGLPARGETLVHADSSFVPAYGARVAMKGDISIPFARPTAGVSSLRDYLAMRGIYSEFHARIAGTMLPPPWYKRAVSSLRNAVLSSFDAYFPYGRAEVMAGIIMGEKAGLPDALYGDFQKAGALHILVASGGNVGFVIFLAFWLLRKLRTGRKESTIIALAVAGVYTVAAGADPPLVRAYIMASAAAAGFVLERNSGPFQSLLIAAAGILAGEPFSLFRADFQMSFLAALSIIIVFSCIDGKKFGRISGYIIAAVLSSAAPQLMLMPISINLFGGASIAGFAANLVVVPLAGVLMAGGFLLTILHAAGTIFLAHFVSLLISVPLFIMLETIKISSSFKFSLISSGAVGWPCVTAYYALIIPILHFGKPQTMKKLAVPACAIFIIAAGAAFLTPRRGIITDIESGHSRSILIRTTTGDTILIGAGASAEDTAKAVLASGTKRVDALLIPAPQPDQSSELAELASMIEIRKIYIPYGRLADQTEAFLSAKGKTSSVRAARFWPGEETLSGNGWKLVAAWENGGYSGRWSRDGIEYTLKLAQGDISFHSSSNTPPHAKPLNGDNEFDIIFRRGARVILDGEHFKCTQD